MKFESIVEGETYYTVTREKMAKTSIKTVVVHTIHVAKTDTVNQTVFASWNGNDVQIFYFSDYSKWRETEPLLVGGLLKRLATRKEIAAAKEIIGQSNKSCYIDKLCRVNYLDGSYITHVKHSPAWLTQVVNIENGYVISGLFKFSQESFFKSHIVLSGPFDAQKSDEKLNMVTVQE